MQLGDGSDASTSGPGYQGHAQHLTIISISLQDDCVNETAAAGFDGRKADDAR
jgi:hypothetical protein